MRRSVLVALLALLVCGAVLAVLFLRSERPAGNDAHDAGAAVEQETGRKEELLTSAEVPAGRIPLEDGTPRAATPAGELISGTVVVEDGIPDGEDVRVVAV